MKKFKEKDLQLFWDEINSNKLSMDQLKQKYSVEEAKRLCTCKKCNSCEGKEAVKKVVKQKKSN